MHWRHNLCTGKREARGKHEGWGDTGWGCCMLIWRLGGVREGHEARAGQVHGEA